MPKSKLKKNTVSISDISNAITNTPPASDAEEAIPAPAPEASPSPVSDQETREEESFGYTQFFTEDDYQATPETEQEAPAETVEDTAEDVVTEAPTPAPQPSEMPAEPSETPAEQVKPTPAKESSEPPKNPAGVFYLETEDEDHNHDQIASSEDKPSLFVFEWACGKFSYHAGELAFIGTKNADMLLPSKIDGFETGVSRRHALLEEEHGHVWLTDLGSTNGTYLNGDKLRRKESQMLRRGDDIRFGVLHVEVK